MAVNKFFLHALAISFHAGKILVAIFCQQVKFLQVYSSQLQFSLVVLSKFLSTFYPCNNCSNFRLPFLVVGLEQGALGNSSVLIARKMIRISSQFALHCIMITRIISLHHFNSCMALFLYVQTPRTKQSTSWLLSQSRSHKQESSKRKQLSKLQAKSLSPLTCKASPGA